MNFKPKRQVSTLAGKPIIRIMESKKLEENGWKYKTYIIVRITEKEITIRKA